MDITAKVICYKKDEPTGQGDDRQVTVKFRADYEDGRNREWARYTPGLDLTMGLRGAVADRFDEGQGYTLTFTQEGPADADQG